MRALLVEDNPADARLILEILKESQAGTFALQQVARLSLALERLREESFDVVLLDLGLPDSQGIETLTLMQQASGGVPIVVLTGLDDERFALEAVRAGAQDYLVKGRIDSQLLLRTIRYAVERKRAEEEVRRLNAELERRVSERTAQLQAANDELQKEIIERRRVEEALRQSREWLRVTLTSIGDAVIVTDTTGRVTFLNPVAVALTGWQPEEAQRQPVRNVFQIVNEQTGIPAEDIVTRVLEVGHVVETAGHTALITKDGRQIPIEDSAAPILNSAGTVVGVVLVFYDVTGKRRAQEALRESEERFRLMVDGVRDYAIFMLDPQGRVSTWNAGAQRLKGYTAEQILGQHFSRFYPPEDVSAGRPRQVLALAIEQGKYAEEGWRVRQDGSRFLASVTITAVYNPTGQLRGFAKLTRDVTERKQAEAALLRSEKLAALGRMAATIAHEVNNPLAAATNAIYIASSDPSLSPQTRSVLFLADQELRRAAHITARTLGFYRDHNAPTPVELPRLIDEILGMYAGKLQERGISVQRRYRCCACPRACFVANVGELRQVISNLLMNGMDAIRDHGTMHLRLARFSRLSGEGPVIRLTIADTGSGIRTEHLQRIFEPFFTTKETVGTGLGLWISQEIIRKHGGAIRVRSQVGKGTVCSVTVPAMPLGARSTADCGTPDAEGHCAALMLASSTKTAS